MNRDEISHFTLYLDDDQGGGELRVSHVALLKGELEYPPFAEPNVKA